MSPALRPFALCCVGLCSLALAADPATKKPPAKSTAAKSTSTKPKVDLGIGDMNLGEIPKGEGMKRGASEAEKPASESMAVRSEDASYSVVKVQFAKTFQGGTAVSPMTAIPLRGKPPTTEKFSSLVRVKCAQKVGASIEMVVLDPRGDTAMSASGQLNYKGAKGDEIDYVVDWDPTPCRAGGKFQFLVRIGGQPMGTWPMQVDEKP